MESIELAGNSRPTAILLTHLFINNVLNNEDT